ncbi:MAG: AAA family ATPase [Congregibacter sp.]
MKLRALRLNQFRKFTTPVALQGLQDGLNVLTGPNEFGKSTLLRALHAVMFERHGSSAAPIKALCNKESEAAPVVEACFELDGASYLIRKRFLRKPYAKLQMPNGSILEGERAEDTLRELLSFARPGNQGAKADDLGVWSMLWISQGAALGSVEVPELARSTLRNALETSVGQILGGEQSQRLPAVIAKALGEHMTLTGKVRGPYKVALESVTELESMRDELRNRRDALQRDLDALESLRESLLRHQTENQDSALRMELEQAQIRRMELGELNAKTDAARAELSHLEMTAQQAGERLAERLGLAQMVEAANHRYIALEQELSVANEERARLKRTLDEARAAQASAAGAKREADVARHAATQAHRGAQLTVSHQVLTQRLEQAEELALAQREHASALELNRVTDTAMHAINDASLRLQSAQSRISAAATQISFTIDSAAQGAVSIAGQPVAAGQSTLEAFESTSIDIKNVGSIVVSPTIKDAQVLQTALDEADQELQEVLAEVGVASLAEAREQARRRTVLATDARDAQLRLETLAASAGGLPALRDESEQTGRMLAALQDETTGGLFPAVSESQRALDAAQEMAEHADAVLQQTRDRVDSTAVSLAAHIDDWEQRRGEAVVQAQELDRLRDELQHAQAPDTLQDTVRDASRRLTQQIAAIAALEALAEGDTAEAVAARIQRLQEALQAQTQKKVDMEKEQARVQGSIASAEGAGLDEKLAETERALGFAQQDVARYKKEAAVLSLLADTLRTAEQQAHDRFMAPVIAKVQPYLNVVFPGAKIDLDATMQVSGILRPGSEAQDFALLSMGTQEQITVLTRIAFAELMAEQGRPAMLVLDDALAYSDDARMARLFDVLTLAARNVQILLLTCREQSFAGIGGNQLMLEAVDEGELQSA